MLELVAVGVSAVVDFVLLLVEEVGVVVETVEHGRDLDVAAEVAGDHEQHDFVFLLPLEVLFLAVDIVTRTPLHVVERVQRSCSHIVVGLHLLEKEDRLELWDSQKRMETQVKTR